MLDLLCHDVRNDCADPVMAAGVARGTALAAMSAMTLTVIAGSANVPLATSISDELGVKPRERVLQRFADGELHVEIEESIRGHDVYVIQSTSLRSTST